MSRTSFSLDAYELKRIRPHCISSRRSQRFSGWILGDATRRGRKGKRAKEKNRGKGKQGKGMPNFYPKVTPVTILSDRRDAANATSLNPLMSTLKPHSNGPLYSNTLAVDWLAVTFGTPRRDLGGLLPRSVPFSLYEINVTAHLSTANVPIHIIRCGTIIASAL